MGAEGGYHYCDPHRMAVRKAVMAHFAARGIPDTKREGLWWRWVKQKGYRYPNELQRTH
jgi:hypothetical protein